MITNGVSGLRPPSTQDAETFSSGSVMVASDPLLALAELLINADYLRSELDRENLQAARETQAAAMSRQIDSLHAAADAVAEGALVEASFTVAGSVLSGVSTVQGASAEDASDLTTARLLGEEGGMLKSLAAPAGRLAGDAPRLHAEADAKQAEQEAEQAGWQADDAREHQRWVADHSDRLLDAASTIIESEHAGNLAILANS